MFSNPADDVIQRAAVALLQLGKATGIAGRIRDEVCIRAGVAALAQPVEHVIRNDGVRCSSHLSGTNFFPVQIIAGDSRVKLGTRPLKDEIGLGQNDQMRQLDLEIGDAVTVSVALHDCHVER